MSKIRIETQHGIQTLYINDVKQDIEVIAVGMTSRSYLGGAPYIKLELAADLIEVIQTDDLFPPGEDT